VAATNRRRPRSKGHGTLAQAAVGQAARHDELNPGGGVIAFRSQHEAAWIGYYDARRRAGFGGYASADLGQLDVWAAPPRA